MEMSVTSNVHLRAAAIFSPRLSPGVIARSVSETHDKSKPWNQIGAGTGSGCAGFRLAPSLCKRVRLLHLSGDFNQARLILTGARAESRGRRGAIPIIGGGDDERRLEEERVRDGAALRGHCGAVR